MSDTTIYTFYIRLLGYLEAVNLVKKANEGLSVENWMAFLGQGCVQISTTKAKMDDLVVYMQSKDWDFEVSGQTALTREKRLLKNELDKYQDS